MRVQLMSALHIFLGSAAITRYEKLHACEKNQAEIRYPEKTGQKCFSGGG